MEEKQRQKERPRTAMHCSAISQSIAVVRKRPRRNGMTARSWILCACLFLVLLNPNTAQSPTTAPETDPPVASPVEPTETDPPTDSPTANTTANPTRRPTSAPTDPPSLEITDSPTIMPTTRMPSFSPSDEASESPTMIDSSAPSQGPSLSPSLSPDSPSDRPSKEPSSESSPRPSTSPTHTPSSDPTISSDLPLQSDLVQVFMSFDDCQKLQGKSVITFESVTANFIEAALETTSPPLMDLTVGINIINQKTPESIRSNADSVRRNNIRFLQASPLVIVFDTSVDFRSISTDYDMPSLIGDAFDTDADKERYIQSLQATGDPAFSNIISMRLEINADEPPNDETDETLYIIIGAAVGGTLLLGIGAFFFVRSRRTAKRAKNIAGTQNTTSLDEKRMQTEIVVDHQDDVSTLGDPTFGASMHQIAGLLDKDETVAGQSFVSGDYEYSKAYGVAGGQRSTATSSDTSKRTGLVVFGSELGQDSMLSDDDSFEEQFHGEVLINVIAPAGKLGMVVDTPAGGVPVVHAIKETSVVSSQVKVGDRLLSVDGEDCSGLTAMQVSKLISQKAQNPARALVFSRPHGRLSTS